VIEHSVSMVGHKLGDAHKAAGLLAGELTARERPVNVTFDDEVSVLVSSTPVGDPQLFLAAINTIQSGSSTVLFDGWRAGAIQVAEHLEPIGLKRMLLLSDGQANVGLSDQASIRNQGGGPSPTGRQY
jgi:Ca-activated chloride channel family protein